jgi:hypothetical protein
LAWKEKGLKKTKNKKQKNSRKFFWEGNFKNLLEEFVIFYFQE